MNIQDTGKSEGNSAHVDPYEIYRINLSLIEARYPEISTEIESISIDDLNHSINCEHIPTLLVNNIQLNSRFDPWKEADLRIKEIQQSSIITVFGFECGYTARRILATRDDINTINIQILNLAIFKLVLHLGPLEDILSNPAIHFKYGEQTHPITAGKYITITPELIMSDDKSWKSRDALIYNSITPKNNKKFNAWASTYSNTTKIEFNLEKANGVSQLFNTKPLAHAYVVATGPTAERQTQRLKQILDIDNECIVIACDTAVRGLINAEIRPDYIVTTDPGITNEHIDPNYLKDVTLVYGIDSPAELIKQWSKDNSYLYLSSVKEHDKYEKLVNKGRLFGGGSVIHPATDLAVKLGCGSITFLGADFSYPYGRTHSYWDDGVLGLNPNGKHWILNGRNEKVPSDTILACYLIALEHLIAISNTAAFFNASLDGAKIKGTEIDPTFLPI